VSTNAYLVSNTYRGLRKVVAMAVEAMVLKISHNLLGPAK